MSVELAGRLLRSGLIPEADVQAALQLTATRGVPFVVALADRGGDVARILGQELERADTPLSRSPKPAGSLIESLPNGMCERLLAVPIRLDPRSGAVDVAAVDPYDTHVVREFAHQLEAPVRLLRTPLPDMLEVLGRVERGRQSVPPPPPAPSKRPTPAFGLGQSEPSAPSQSSPPPAEARIPSAPPIPLVRKSPESLRAEAEAEEPPRFERHRTNPGFAAPPKETFGQDASGEPIIGLYRSKPPPAPSVESLPPAPQIIDDVDLGVENLAPFLEGLEMAEMPDEIVDLMVDAMSIAANKVAVFVVRGEHFQGRSGTSSLGSPEELRALSIPTTEPSILETAVQAGYYLGSLPHTASHESLRRLFRVEDEEVYATPSLVSSQPVLVLVAGELRESATSTRWADQLARAGADALARILRGRK